MTIFLGLLDGLLFAFLFFGLFLARLFLFLGDDLLLHVDLLHYEVTVRVSVALDLNVHFLLFDLLRFGDGLAGTDLGVVVVIVVIVVDFVSPVLPGFLFYWLLFSNRLLLLFGLYHGNTHLNRRQYMIITLMGLPDNNTPPSVYDTPDSSTLPSPCDTRCVYTAGLTGGDIACINTPACKIHTALAWSV